MKKLVTICYITIKLLVRYAAQRSATRQMQERTPPPPSLLTRGFILFSLPFPSLAILHIRPLINATLPCGPITAYN